MEISFSSVGKSVAYNARDQTPLVTLHFSKIKYAPLLHKKNKILNEMTIYFDNVDFYFDNVFINLYNISNKLYIINNKTNMRKLCVTFITLGKGTLV